MTYYFKGQKTLDYLKTLIKIDESGCWIWQRSISNLGYGQVYFDRKVQKAHRVFFKLSGHQIPDGTELDHICRTRSCVNPSHLRAVSHKENILAATMLKAACKHGHEFTHDNVYLTKKKIRVCKKCRYQRIKLWRSRHPEQAAISYRNSYRLRKIAWEKAGLPCGSKGKGPSAPLDVIENSTVQVESGLTMQHNG